MTLHPAERKSATFDEGPLVVVVVLADVVEMLVVVVMGSGYETLVLLE